MASKYSIEAVFSAVDRMTKPLRSMSAASSRFTRGMRTDFVKAQREADRLRSSMSSAFGTGLKRAAQIGIGGVVVGLGIATKEFIDYDQAITASAAKFKDLDTNTKEGRQAMDALRKTARKVGAETQFSATQAAQGLDFLAMAGFTSRQSMAMLPGVVDLATVANVELGRATDIASDALGAFGLMTEDTAQLQKNLDRVMDVAAKTTTMFNTDLDTLFEAVKKGAPSFTAAGQSMESFNALIGVMASSGVKGAESGTALRNVMLRLSAPVGEAQKIMDKLGVTTQDSGGNFRDVIDILGDFEKGLVGMGTAQRTAALTTVFGARSVTGVNLLLAEGTEKLREHRDALLSSQGAAKKMADFMRGSLMNRLNILKSTLIETGFKFIDAFEGDGSSALQTITTAIQQFDMKPVIEGFKTFFRVLKNVWDVIGPAVPIILSMVLAYKAYQKALVAIALIQTIVNTTNPIGWIMIAVGVITLLYKNWDKVVDGFRRFFDWALPGIVGFGKAIMRGIMTPINLVIAGIIRLLLIAAKIPGIGDKFKKAANWMQGMQEKMNSPFAEVNAGDEQRNVQTQREAVQKTIEQRRSTQEVLIRNDSENKVSTRGEEIPRGTSLKLSPSGSW